MPDPSPRGDSPYRPRDQRHLQAIAAGIERDYPLAPRRTLVSLIDVDTEQFQAQWQVEPGHLALALGAFPTGHAGLHQRIRLLRLDAWPQEVASLDLPAAELGAQGVARFLVVEGAGFAYQAELGLVSPEGGWLLLGRSQPASLPGPLQPAIETSHSRPKHPSLLTEPAHQIGLSRPSLSRSSSWPALAGEESALEEPPLSPPWDPTLADPGYPLDPRFPTASHRAPCKFETGAGAGEGRGRGNSHPPDPAIPPLVIIRSLSPPLVGVGASPPGTSCNATYSGAGLGKGSPDLVPLRDATSPAAAHGAGIRRVAPLGDATSPAAGLGPASPAGVPRLLTLGRLPSFSRPWGQPGSATGCWLFDYETTAEVSAVNPRPLAELGTPASA